MTGTEQMLLDTAGKMLEAALTNSARERYRGLSDTEKLHYVQFMLDNPGLTRLDEDRDKRVVHDDCIELSFPFGFTALVDSDQKDQDFRLVPAQGNTKVHIVVRVLSGKAAVYLADKRGMTHRALKGAKGDSMHVNHMYDKLDCRRSSLSVETPAVNLSLGAAEKQAA